jgi:hypothetical protein
MCPLRTLSIRLSRLPYEPERDRFSARSRGPGTGTQRRTDGGTHKWILISLFPMLVVWGLYVHLPQWRGSGPDFGNDPWGTG